MDKNSSVKRILYYFGLAYSKSKMRTFWLFLSIIVRSALSYYVTPIGVSQIIGKLAEGDYIFADYLPLFGVVFGSAIASCILVRVIDWLDWSLDARGGEFLQNKAFDAVVNQSMSFHNDRFSGSLTAQTSRLANGFINFKSTITWDIAPLILSVVFAMMAAWGVSPIYSLILLAFAVAFVLVAFIMFKRTRAIDEKVSKTYNKQSGQVADAITNVLNIKSFANEKYEKCRIAKANHEIYDATFDLARVSMRRHMPLDLTQIIVQFTMLALIILGHDLFGITIANAVLIYNLTSEVIGKVWSVSGVFRSFNRAFGDAREMVEILDMPVIIDDKTDVPLTINEPTVEFSHISFQHDEQKTKLFDDFSLKINAGERVGLVGISGSGKTTLTKLLLRFTDVDNGAIYIDGHDIRDVTQGSLREKIAYVPQESSLFHRSIRDNIAYGRLDALDKEIIKAAKLANADVFIKDLPDGYNTLVGERGVKLSGGQRQRVAIARAILKDAPILVLDEATSALDSESEALIQEALSNLMKDRTSIVIAHRLSTVAGLDRIVVLDNGRIVEQGNHKELLAKNGAYKRLWERQSGAFLTKK